MNRDDIKIFLAIARMGGLKNLQMNWALITYHVIEELMP